MFSTQKNRLFLFPLELCIWVTWKHHSQIMLSEDSMDALQLENPHPCSTPSFNVNSSKMFSSVWTWLNHLARQERSVRISFLILFHVRLGPNHFAEFWMAEQKQKPYAFCTQKVNQLRSTRHSWSLLADLPHGHGAAAKPAATLVPKNLLSFLPIPGSHVGLAQK